MAAVLLAPSAFAVAAAPRNSVIMRLIAKTQREGEDAALTEEFYDYLSPEMPCRALHFAEGDDPQAHSVYVVEEFRDGELIVTHVLLTRRISEEKEHGFYKFLVTPRGMLFKFIEIDVPTNHGRARAISMGPDREVKNAIFDREVAFYRKELRRY